MALINRAAHDLAENVIAPFVTGKNSVGDRESRSTSVVGNYPHRKPFLSFQARNYDPQAVQ